MAVTTNGSAASNAIGANLTGGTAHTFTYNCPANTDCLVFVEGQALASGGTPSGKPTAFSYNGTALTYVTGSYSAAAAGDPFAVSMWYYLMPPTGSADTVSITYTDTLNGQITAIVPLIGTNQSTPVGTAAINAAASGTTASVSASGSGSNGLYVGVAMSAQNPVTGQGGSQTTLKTQTCRSTEQLSLDDYVAGSSGAFSWTVPNVDWVCAAVAFLSAGGGTSLVPPVGSNNYTGNTPTVTPATAVVVTPLQARRTESGLIVCERPRKIFLPSWRKAA